MKKEFNDIKKDIYEAKKEMSYSVASVEQKKNDVEKKVNDHESNFENKLDKLERIFDNKIDMSGRLLTNKLDMHGLKDQTLENKLDVLTGELGLLEALIQGQDKKIDGKIESLRNKYDYLLKDLIKNLKKYNSNNRY